MEKIMDKYIGGNEGLPTTVKNGYEYTKSIVKKYGNLEARAREQANAAETKAEVKTE